jgi:hypothetical protein
VSLLTGGRAAGGAFRRQISPARPTWGHCCWGAGAAGAPQAGRGRPRRINGAGLAPKASRCPRQRPRAAVHCIASFVFGSRGEAYCPSLGNLVWRAAARAQRGVRGRARTARSAALRAAVNRVARVRPARRGAMARVLPPRGRWDVSNGGGGRVYIGRCAIIRRQEVPAGRVGAAWPCWGRGAGKEKSRGGGSQASRRARARGHVLGPRRGARRGQGRVAQRPGASEVRRRAPLAWGARRCAERKTKCCHRSAGAKTNGGRRHASEQQAPRAARTRTRALGTGCGTRGEEG